MIHTFQRAPADDCSVRVISVRKATRKEGRQYQEGAYEKGIRFSKERGKFYHAGVELNVSVYLEADIAKVVVNGRERSMQVRGRSSTSDSAERLMAQRVRPSRDRPAIDLVANRSTARYADADYWCEASHGVVWPTGDSLTGMWGAMGTMSRGLPTFVSSAKRATFT